MAGVGAHGRGIDLPPPRVEKEIRIEDVEDKVSSPCSPARALEASSTDTDAL